MIDYFTATREEVFFMAIRNRMHLSTIAIKERSVAPSCIILSHRSDHTCTIKDRSSSHSQWGYVYVYVCARKLTGEPWQRNTKLVSRKSWLKLRVCSLSCLLDGEYYRYVSGLYDSCLLLDSISIRQRFSFIVFMMDSVFGNHIVLNVVCTLKYFCFCVLKQTIFYRIFKFMKPVCDEVILQWM